MIECSYRRRTEAIEMRISRKLLAATGAIAALGAAPASAPAEETTCRGSIGSQTHDNIRVPQGASCTLNGTLAQGTVKIERDAVLRARDVRVIGNVQGEEARRVNVMDGSRIGGSVQVVQGGAARVADSRLTGDILYDENSRRLKALRNRVGGNVQAFQNEGGVRIARNVIDGNLQCKENTPAPTGGGNIVHGNREDQCASL
jgi:hypothetical protein